MAPTLRTSTKKKTVASVRADKGKRRTEVVTKVPVPKVIVKNLHCVGGSVEQDSAWFNSFPHLPRRLLALQKGKDNKIFLYLSSEPYLTRQHIVQNVPVVIAVKCKSIPTLLATEASVQLANVSPGEHIKTYGLSWEPIENNKKKIFTLQANQRTSDYLLLRLCKPTDVAMETPNSISTVSVEYKEQDVVWSRDAEPQLSDVVEDYREEGMDVNEEELRGLLTTELKSQEEKETNRVSSVKTIFHSMLTEIASIESTTVDDVENHINGMKVFKIYPTGLPAPQATAFGPSGGFQPNLDVNRFCKADMFFTS